MVRRVPILLYLALAVVTVSLTSAQILPGSMAGMLGAAFRDYRDGTSTVDYTLYTFDGAKVPLTIPDDVIAAAGGFFALQDTPVEIVLGLPTRDGARSAAAIHPAAGPRFFDLDPVGTIPWSFHLCAFDNIAGVPIASADVETMNGNTGFGTGAYWAETSHGITTTSTTVHDWANIGHKRSYYTGMDPLSAIDAYLTDCPAAHGLTLSGSFNVAIALNEQMFYQDFALGLYGYDDFNVQRAIFLPDWAISNHTVVAHEMGHAYGLPHSDNFDWDANPYDNPWDVMSDSFWAFAQAPFGTIGTPTNAYYYRQIGMLPDERLFTFASVGGSAVVTVDDWMVADSPNYQAIFINQPNAADRTLYVVEVHKGTTGGFNSGYRPLGVPTDAVIIYNTQYTDGQRPPIKLVGGYSDKKSYNMSSVWSVGETFTDPTLDISISVVAATENGFSVMVRQGKFEAITGASPLLGAVMSDPNVAYTWNDKAGVAVYTVQVKSADGQQTLSFDVPGGCGVCIATTDYAAHGWKWKQGEYYRWRVSGENSAGDRFAQSGWNSFRVEAIQSFFPIIQPVQNAVLTGSVLNVTFATDPEVGQYRVQVARDGDSIRTPWSDQQAICIAETCALSVDLTAFPGGAKDGAYEFKVHARSSLIAGIFKSSKRRFTLDN